MDTKYEIIKYTPEFKSQIADLQKHLWSPDVSVNAAYLEWKYENNPYLEAPLIYMALCSGKVVGMRGVYGVKWQIDHPPQTLPALCTGDSVVAPDHRNRGLFQEISKVALSDVANFGCDYVFSTSPAPVTQLTSMKMGWRSVGPLQTAHWPTRQGMRSGRLRKYANRLPLFASIYRRMRGHTRKLLSNSHSDERRFPFDALDRNGIQNSDNKNSHIVVEKIPRPEAMAELVERIGNDGRIRHVRDRQYFDWRFNNPLSLYRFLFWEGATLEGYLVLQAGLYEDKGRVNIVDLEAANFQVRSDLLQTAIRLGNFNSLTIWSATLLDEIKAVLQNIGFNFVNETGSVIREVHRPTVIISPVRQEMRQSGWFFANVRLLDLANWDLRMIYSDNF